MQAESCKASSSVPETPAATEDAAASALKRRQFIDGLEQGDQKAASKCRQLVDKALTTCPKVKFMRDALERLGVRTEEDFVTCAHCPDGAAAAGGCMPDQRLVVLCQQWVAKQPGEVENTLVHEMV